MDITKELIGCLRPPLSHKHTNEPSQHQEGVDWAIQTLERQRLEMQQRVL